MRTQKFSSNQLKCNFCYNWFTSRNSLQPPSGMSICQGCFTKARSSTSFKLLDPTTFELYELKLFKTGLLPDQARSITNLNIAQLLDFYEKRGLKEKQSVHFLTGSLNELNTLQNQLYECTAGIREFVNGIYHKEIGRIEAIWSNILLELDSASKLIDKERERMKSCLSTYTYDFVTDNQKLVSSEEFAKRLQQIKDEAKRVFGISLPSLQELFAKNSEFFFCKGFNLHDAGMPVKVMFEDQCSEFQLPEVYAKLEQSIQKHRQGIPPPKKALKEKDQNLNSAKKSSLKPPKCPPQVNSIRGVSSFDQENFLLQTPLPLERVRVEGTPNQNFLTNRKEPVEGSARNFSSFGRTNRKEPAMYEAIDFKNFREWPREKVLQLLQRSKSSLPKGYKPGDEKPQLLRCYPKKVMSSSICEALDHTFNNGSLLELIGYDTSSLEFLSYLNMLDWGERTEVVKFVSVALTDENFNLLLCLVEKHKKVETLVASSNHLTEKSLEMLLNFCRQYNHLRTVYLGRNYISQLKAKPILQQLKALGVTIYV